MPNKNLSYTNLFNQQKIIVDDSQVVNVPNTFTLTTILTVATGQDVTPTARVFIEYNGIMAPLYTSRSGTFRTIGKLAGFYVFFNAINALVIQTLSLDTFSPTIYYRIYKDGRPT